MGTPAFSWGLTGLQARLPRRAPVAAHCIAAKAAAASLVTPLELSLVLSDVQKDYFREVTPARGLPRLDPVQPPGSVHPHIHQVRAGEAEDLNMAAPSDFFELLQVSTDATPEDVRTAYRALQRYCSSRHRRSGA